MNEAWNECPKCEEISMPPWRRTAQARACNWCGHIEERAPGTANASQPEAAPPAGGNNG